MSHSYPNCGTRIKEETTCRCDKCNKTVNIPPDAAKSAPGPRGEFFTLCPEGCGRVLTVMPDQFT